MNSIVSKDSAKSYRIIRVSVEAVRACISVEKGEVVMK